MASIGILKTLPITFKDSWHRNHETLIFSSSDYLDGTKPQEELLSYVYRDIIQELNKLKEESK